MKATFLLAPVVAANLAVLSGGALAQALPANSPSTEAATSGPVIRTQQGKVQGVVANDVAVFKGLPFAAPPVGDLRWQEPKAPAKWSDTRAANAYGSSCQAAEDCL